MPWALQPLSTYHPFFPQVLLSSQELSLLLGTEQTLCVAFRNVLSNAEGNHVVNTICQLYFILYANILFLFFICSRTNKSTLLKMALIKWHKASTTIFFRLKFFEYFTCCWKENIGNRLKWYRCRARKLVKLIYWIILLSMLYLATWYLLWVFSTFL